MAKDTQQLEVGTAQGLLWRCRLQPDSKQHDSSLCWAYLCLEAQGQILWEIDNWPLVDLLSGLGRIWPWLLHEEGYPININPEHVGHLMSAAEQLWRELPNSQLEEDAQDEILFDYRQRHDLSLLLRGINVPSVWILREGLNCQIWSPAMNNVGYANHEQVMQSLRDLGNALAQNIENCPLPKRQPRATQALERWQQKQSHTKARFLQIVTGWTKDQIEYLKSQKMSPDALFEVPNDSANENFIAQGNELQMAARMTRDALKPKDQVELLQHIQAIPLIDRGKLDEISQCTPQLNEMDVPYAQGYQLALWLREYFRHDETKPMNPEKILIDLGITPKNVSVAGSIDAAAVWGPNHGPAILVNEHRLSRARGTNGRRTTLAHELCHLLVDRKSAFPAVEVLGGQVARKAEQRANAFAAELLLPRTVAAKACGNEPLGILSAAEKLQIKYQVSREVVFNQIQNSIVGATLRPQDRLELEQWVAEASHSLS